MGRREWQERKEERKGEGEKNEGRGKGRIDFGLLQLHHGWRQRGGGGSCPVLCPGPSWLPPSSCQDDDAVCPLTAFNSCEANQISVKFLGYVTCHSVNIAQFDRPSGKVVYCRAALAVMRCPSVCVCVCPSRSWILSKRVNMSDFFHLRVATLFQFYRSKRHGSILTGTPSPLIGTSASNGREVG